MQVLEASKTESARSIAQKFNCGKTQIQAVIQSWEEILRRWNTGAKTTQKYAKARRTTYSGLNELVWDWFCKARSKNIPITGRLIQEKAMMLSLELNHDDFTASLNDWLESFQKRHNIAASLLSGEAADVPQDTVDQRQPRLASICEGYDARNIFNADETGLFYRAMPQQSLAKKSDPAKDKSLHPPPPSPWPVIPVRAESSAKTE